MVEDATSLQLDVLQNDTTPAGTSGVVIQSITQPSNGVNGVDRIRPEESAIYS